MVELAGHQFENIIPGGAEIHAPASGLPEQIRGVKIDSRNCKSGDLFVALPGENTHGHVYLEDAVEAGAAVAVVEEPRPVEIPQLVVADSLEALQELASNFRAEIDSRVIGITGSCGKTTVKEMVAGLLSAVFSVGKTPGNYNNQIGLPLTVLNEGGKDVLVAEVATNQPGEIKLLTSILRPGVGIITHIGPAHLAGLSSVENLADEKSDLLAGLPEDGLAVIPDDLKHMDRIKASSSVEPVKVGSSARADYRVNWRKNGENTVMNVEGREISLPLTRNELLRDAALAFCVAENLGVPPEKLNGQIENLSPVEGRGQQENISDCLLIDGSYNANPDSVISALDHLLELPAPRLIVLGDMLELGDEAGRLHQKVGHKLAEFSDSEIHYVGEYGAKIKDGAGDKVGINFYDKVDEIMDLTPRGFKSALVKSSHAVGLHRLVEKWRDNQ
ncbi:MAG: UDP-N-acetylmuramoyl-tripeptide--D-alanyl-D-alanine ligase [bacterium]